MEGNGSPKTPERRFSRRLSSLNSVQADESSAAEEKSPTIKRRFRSKKKPPPDNAGKRFYFINSVKILFLETPEPRQPIRDLYSKTSTTDPGKRLILYEKYLIILYEKYLIIFQKISDYFSKNI